MNQCHSLTLCQWLRKEKKLNYAGKNNNNNNNSISGLTSAFNAHFILENEILFPRNKMPANMPQHVTTKCYTIARVFTASNVSLTKRI